MKSISASIVILAGTVLIVRGSSIPHDGTAFFVHAVGLALIFIGIWGWRVSLIEK